MFVTVPRGAHRCDIAESNEIGHAHIVMLVDRVDVQLGVVHQ